MQLLIEWQMPPWVSWDFGLCRGRGGSVWLDIGPVLSLRVMQRQWSRIVETSRSDKRSELGDSWTRAGQQDQVGPWVGKGGKLTVKAVKWGTTGLEH